MNSLKKKTLELQKKVATKDVKKIINFINNEFENKKFTDQKVAVKFFKDTLDNLVKEKKIVGYTGTRLSGHSIFAEITTSAKKVITISFDYSE